MSVCDGETNFAAVCRASDMLVGPASSRLDIFVPSIDVVTPHTMLKQNSLLAMVARELIIENTLSKQIDWFTRHLPFRQP